MAAAYPHTYPTGYYGQPSAGCIVHGTVAVTYAYGDIAYVSTSVSNNHEPWTARDWALDIPNPTPVLCRWGLYPQKLRPPVNPCAAAGMPPQPPPVSLALCTSNPHDRPAPPRRRLRSAFRGPWQESATRARRSRRRRLRVWERGETR